MRTVVVSRARAPPITGGAQMRLVAPARERVVTNRRRVWISGIGGPVYAGPGYRCVVRTGRATSLRRCAACRHMPFVTRAALLQLALSPAARLLGLTAMAGTGAAAAERGDEPQRPVRWKGAVKLAPATKVSLPPLATECCECSARPLWVELPRPAQGREGLESALRRRAAADAFSATSRSPTVRLLRIKRAVRPKPRPLL